MNELTHLLARLWSLASYPLFTVHTTHVTLLTGLMLVAIAVATLWLGRWVERTLVEQLVARVRLDPGVAFTMGRIAHYAVVALGIYLGLQLLGLELGALAVVAGFLSIGIGFGLQNVTSNFVSGLIIMAERPIKPGDRVRVRDNIGQVVSIRLRSTTIVTNDNIAVIVPNSEFITQEVVNWSYGNPQLRLHLPVGLAYGSDPDAATEALLAAARSHPDVLATPEPAVWLNEFGDNALGFELLAWIADPVQAQAIRSDLNFAILRECTARSLELVFPQRDLHLRSAVPLRVEIADGPAS
jgi:small-conductance mechanosensitive channel